MCSHCESEHPDEQKFVQEFNARRLQPTEDSFGQDVFQSLLAVSYSRYILNSTRNLMGHLYQSSPLVGIRKVL